MIEIEIKEHSVFHVFYLEDEQGIKFCFSPKVNFSQIVMRLDLFARNENRRFGYEVDEPAKSILFTLDIPQAMGLMEGFGVIKNDSKRKILGAVGAGTIDEQFEKEEVKIPASSSPKHFIRK